VDDLVEMWEPTTPLLVVAALRHTPNATAQDIRAFVRHVRLQFTEPLRSSLVLAGLLQTAHEYDRPIRLLEIGASAGVLLGVDRYRHVFPTGEWGPRDAPLTLRSPLRVPPHLLIAELQIIRSRWGRSCAT
jgi:hypothetical protein